MLLSPLFLAVSILCAQEETKIDALLDQSIKIERIAQNGEFSPQSAYEEEKGVVDDIQYPQESKEVAHKLAEKQVEIEVEESLKGMIEKQTGHILQNQHKEEEIADALEPVTEDLVQFVRQPKITVSEPILDYSTYERLHITFEEKQKISNILMTLAENNVFKLLFEKKRLERLGHEINHVHPIRFLGTVFSDPRLVYCLHKIRGSTFKWGGFIDGFTERFKQEIQAQNVNAYLPGLAQHLHVSEEDLRTYINDQNIEGLILFLMEKGRH